MLLAVGKCQRNDFSDLKADEQLCFLVCAAFAFLGRSIGDSAASTRIASSSVSFFSGAFRPGREKVPSRIRIFRPFYHCSLFSQEV
jgi:hypothetical protein